jgi:hypothetical protein
MDALTLVSMIAFGALFISWLGLPEKSAEASIVSEMPKPEAMAA